MRLFHLPVEGVRPLTGAPGISQITFSLSPEMGTGGDIELQLSVGNLATNGAVIPVRRPINIVFDGNSIVQGAYATDDKHSFVSRTLEILGNKYSGTNLGIGGLTTARLLDLQSRTYEYVDPLARNFVVFWEISNDATTATSAEDCVKRRSMITSPTLKKTVSSAFVLTMLPRTGLLGAESVTSMETKRQAINRCFGRTMAHISWSSILI